MFAHKNFLTTQFVNRLNPLIRKRKQEKKFIRSPVTLPIYTLHIKWFPRGQQEKKRKNNDGSSMGESREKNTSRGRNRSSQGVERIDVDDSSVHPFRSYQRQRTFSFLISYCTNSPICSYAVIISQGSLPNRISTSPLSTNVEELPPAIDGNPITYLNDGDAIQSERSRPNEIASRGTGRERGIGTCV